EALDVLLDSAPIESLPRVRVPRSGGQGAGSRSALVTPNSGRASSAPRRTGGRKFGSRPTWAKLFASRLELEGTRMRRTPYPWLLATALLCLGGVGCLKDLEDLCQTDADCPEGKRCADVDGVRYCVGDSTGEAGSGGTGGSGGSGGTGGAGGSGGLEPHEAVVDITLEPSPELVEYQENFNRELDKVAFIYM